MRTDPARQQRLIDALQVIGPLAQRIEVTSRQQQLDATALFEATARIVAIIREMRSSANQKGSAQ